MASTTANPFIFGSTTRPNLRLLIPIMDESLPVTAPSTTDTDTDTDIDLQSILDSISHVAQLEIQSQPLRTQVDLTKESRRIFDQYSDHGSATSLRSAITRYFHPTAADESGMAYFPPLPEGYVPPAPDPKDSRMVDEESRNLVREMPFYVDRKIHMRPNVKLPAGLLECLDRIFRIYRFEARAMLTHHCEKYGDEAIFRVGVRSLIMRYASLPLPNSSFSRFTAIFTLAASCKSHLLSYYCLSSPSCYSLVSFFFLLKQSWS
jgi:hypothetical protein